MRHPHMPGSVGRGRDTQPPAPAPVAATVRHLARLTAEALGQDDQETARALADIALFHVYLGFQPALPRNQIPAAHS